MAHLNTTHPTHTRHIHKQTHHGIREREGHVCVAHVRMRIFGFRFSVLVGLVIMKRKLRKLNKIQTNQYGIYLYMPISDIMQIPSPHTHTHTPKHSGTFRETNGRRPTELIELQTELFKFVHIAP